MSSSGSNHSYQLHSADVSKESTSEAKSTFIVDELSAAGKEPTSVLRISDLHYIDRMMSKIIDLTVDADGRIKCVYKPDQNHRFQYNNQVLNLEFKSLNEAAKNLNPPTNSNLRQYITFSFGVIFKLNSNKEIESIYAAKRCEKEPSTSVEKFSLPDNIVFSELREISLSNLYLADLEKAYDSEKLKKDFLAILAYKLFPVPVLLDESIKLSVISKGRLLSPEIAAVQALDSLSQKRLASSTANIIEDFLFKAGDLRVAKLAVMRHKINAYISQLDQKDDRDKEQKKKAAKELIKCISKPVINFNSIDRQYEGFFQQDQLKVLFAQTKRCVADLARRIK